MGRWPPLVWPVMALASLLILMGLGPWEPGSLALGLGLAIAVFAVSYFFASRTWGDEKPDGFRWAMIGLAGFYLVNAAVATVAGPEYTIAVLVAGLIPASAALLMLTTMGRKTHTSRAGARDAAAAAHDDPAPGIGMDDETPLGDTSEHSDAERVATPDRRFR
jgi:hypothetical protein